MGCSKGAGVGWDTARAPDCVFDVSAWHVEGMLVFVLEHVAYVGFACSSAAADLLLWQLGWVKMRLEKSARPPQLRACAAYPWARVPLGDRAGCSLLTVQRAGCSHPCMAKFYAGKSVACD